MAPSTPSRHPHSPTSPTSPTYSTPEHTRYESFSDLVHSQSPTSPTLKPFRRFPRTSKAASELRPSPVLRESGGRVEIGIDTTPEEELVVGGLAEVEGGKKELTTIEMITLTVAMGGAQLTWTVEMAFGTPYLLSMGLSKEATSLVWLAGPLSGLVVQPVIGALSDAHSPRTRRRFYILLSTLLVLLSTLLVAFAKEVAAVICELSGLGDWDPEMGGRRDAWMRGLAVAGFWVLDFGLNGVQASLRALILDKVPSSQQHLSNAYHSRLTALGNILGYTFGYLPLSESPYLEWLGGGQFRRLACLSCVFLAGTVGWTCIGTKEGVEGELHVPQKQGVGSVFRGVKEGIRKLPTEVRRVCCVQFFAWTAYFPFLFYSTTYISQTHLRSHSHPTQPQVDAATRLGSLALLYFALISLVTSSLLPLLAHLSPTKLPAWVRKLVAKATLRNFWTLGLVEFAACMVATVGVGPGETGKAMAVVAMCGISWGIATWVPFALVMEAIRDVEDLPPTILPPSPPSPSPPTTPTTRHSPPFRASLPRLRSSTPQPRPTETSPLLLPASPADINDSAIVRREVETTLKMQKRRSKTGGGTVLGIHNLSIVAPQFFVALVAAGIFRILDGNGKKTIPGEGEGMGSNDVVWVLRFGGLAALAGAVASRWLIMPRTEKGHVRRMFAGVEEEEDEEDEEEDEE